MRPVDFPCPTSRPTFRRPGPPPFRCWRRSFIAPWLPEWLPKLELRGVKIGDGKLDIAIARDGSETVIDSMEARGLEVIRAAVEAPLGGAALAADGAAHG